MKRFLLFTVLLLSFFIGFGQCPNQPITLTTQAEVDAFQATYPNCTSLESTLEITGLDIFNLNALSNITYVDFFLNIHDTNLTSLTGLDNLTYAAFVSIRDNNVLENLQGLNALEEVPFEFFEIVNNPLLESLVGLSSLESVFNLKIENNDALTRFDGLSAISEISLLEILDNAVLNEIDALENALIVGSFSTPIIIENNPNLNSCGVGIICDALNNGLAVTLAGNASGCSSVSYVEDQCNNCPPGDIAFFSQVDIDTFISTYPNCTNLRGGLRISNPNISNLDGLNSIESVQGNLIFINTNLENLSGFDSLTSITDGDLRIISNPLLTSIEALTNLTELQFSILVSNNPNLVSLSGLNQISTSQRSISINNNDALTNLEGLNGILSSQDISIENNDLLTDVSALSNFNTAGQFSIINNNVLENLDNFSDDLEIEFLVIQDNDVLSDLSGIESFSFSSGVDPFISITGNPNLTSCAIEGLCSGIQNPMATITIDANGIGCESVAEVEADCFPCPSAPIFLSSQFEVDNFSINFPNCTDVEGDLWILDNNLITNLDGLAQINSIGGSLDISYNYELSDISGLSGLTSVGGSLLVRENPLLDNLTGLENVSEISEVVIEDNAILNDITALTDVTIGNNGNGLLIISDNPTLSECNILSVCNALNLTTVVISNNGTGCNTVVEVETACDTSQNIISGNVLFDFNSNGCSIDDYNAQNVLIQIEGNSFAQGILTDDLGNYEVFVGDGNFEVSVAPESLPMGFTSSPVLQDVTFVGFGNEEVADFCLTTTNSSTDISVTLTPLQQPRPGFTATYVVQYENIGTTAQSGNIEFTFDETIMSFTSTDETPSNTTSSSVTWDYTDLLSFQSRAFEVDFLLFTPPTVEGGEILTSSVTINPVATDDAPENNTYELEETVVNSWDPNDKQVMQGEEIAPEEVGDYLDYVVRFQNTGSADAINVRIEDELSANLDWNTIKPIASSHSYTVTITEGNAVEFLFENINLPPQELDEEGSNGYIAFKIRSNSDLELGDTVENTASIFFDFNEPIITNTVATTIAEPLNTDDFAFSNDIRVYPVPASSIINVEATNGIEILNLNLYDITGRKTLEKVSKTLDMSTLSDGIYFLKIATNKGTTTRRIVKKS